MKKYFILLPHYQIIDAVDLGSLIDKFKDFNWKKSRREYFKKDVKYLRFQKDYEGDSDKNVISVNVFLFENINLLVYIFDLPSTINVKEDGIIKITQLFKKIADEEISIGYLPERLIPFYVEYYSENEKHLFEKAKNELSNNCYFLEKNDSNELYLGKDSFTKIETLLIKTSFEGYFRDEILKQMILIKSLKEYGDELSKVLSDNIDEDRKLEIYNFIWNYLLYIDKSPVNGFFSRYLNLSLKPLKRLLEYREHGNSKNTIRILESSHIAENVLLTLTFIMILDILSRFIKESNVLMPYLNHVYPKFEIYYAEIFIIFISVVTIYITSKYIYKIFRE